MHHADPYSSPRLARMLNAVQMWPGATTMELQTATKSCAVSTDISELRRSGYIIERVYVGKRDGRQINQYYYRGKK